MRFNRKNFRIINYYTVVGLKKLIFQSVQVHMEFSAETICKYEI